MTRVEFYRKSTVGMFRIHRFSNIDMPRFPNKQKITHQQSTTLERSSQVYCTIPYSSNGPYYDLSISFWWWLLGAKPVMWFPSNSGFYIVFDFVMMDSIPRATKHRRHWDLNMVVLVRSHAIWHWISMMVIYWGIIYSGRSTLLDNPNVWHHKCWICEWLLLLRWQWILHLDTWILEGILTTRTTRYAEISC